MLTVMEVVYVGRLGCGYQGGELIATVTVRTGLSPGALIFSSHRSAGFVSSPMVWTGLVIFRGTQ